MCHISMTVLCHTYRLFNGPKWSLSFSSVLSVYVMAPCPGGSAQCNAMNESVRDLFTGLYVVVTERATHSAITKTSCYDQK